MKQQNTSGWQRIRNKVVDLVVGSIIRRKLRVEDAILDRCSVTLARSPQEYETALRLLRAAYIAQGYENPLEYGCRVTPHHLLPESTVLAGWDGDKLVGTMTATNDSVMGLPMDKVFQDELDSLRDQGLRLMELGSLAVIGRRKGKGVSPILNVAAYRLAVHNYGATHFVLQAHPKAAKVYRALFGFEQVGGVKTHPGLGQPAVAMVLDIAKVVDFMRPRYRRPLADGRPLADHYDQGTPYVTIPPFEPEVLARWKMPPEVFYQVLYPQVATQLDDKWHQHLEQVAPGRLRLVEA